MLEKTKGKDYMAKEKINLRDELRLYKFDFDLLQKIPCTKQENKKYQKLLKEGGVLPEGVFAYSQGTDDVSTTEFYTVYETDLTDSEITEYLTYRKLGMSRIIQNCILVLTISSIIYMVVSIFV